MIVQTKRCMHCGNVGYVEVPDEGWKQWDEGVALIQDAMPALTPGEREQLMTGIHPLCFDKAFPPDEED